MKLKKIKLSGFKSFVDPTTIPLPSHLVAVLGPNGCGKSNVIDAVRWVMGESSAKFLRGESITDVIFNGSSARKPVSQAMVELLFDNSDASLGGEYAKYAEISIKRIVNRDAQSQYFINNTRCRRRDVADIFLGTGLGPRSYAIIEQGMISRFVEAKPDELRIYLEEAAGISKYKERRRETENRIRHTEENLARVNDICEELDKQLAHLQRQARAAERYQALKEEEHRYKAELFVLRWLDLAEKLAEQQQREGQLSNQLHAAETQLQTTLTALEKQHQIHVDTQEQLQNVQDDYYRYGADISKTEQHLQHQRERIQSLETDLQQVTVDLQSNQHTFAADDTQLIQVKEAVTQLTPQFEQAQQQTQYAQKTLNDAQQAQNAWQADWETFQTQLAHATQQAEVEQTRIQHLEQNATSTQARIAQLETELSTQNVHELEQAIQTAQQAHDQLQQDHKGAQVQHDEKKAQITQQRECNDSIYNELDDLRQTLQRAQGRHASLEALQQAALGQRNEAVVEWLSARNLEHAPRLAQTLDVDSQWQTAVETVLGDYLQAVCLDNFDVVTHVLSQLEQGQVIFVNKTQTVVNVSEPELLASKVRHGLPVVQQLLQGIYVAKSLEDALQQLPRLSAQASIITAEGIWLGPDWLRVNRSKEDTQGVLKREQELKSLNNEITQLQTQVTQQEQRLAQGREQLTELEEQQDVQQQLLRELNAKQAELMTQIRVKQTRLEQLQTRREHLQQDIVQQQHQLEKYKTDMQTTRETWQMAMEEIEKKNQNRATLEQQRTVHQHAVQHAREQAQQCAQGQHQIELQLQQAQTQQAALTEQMNRLREHMQHLVERETHLKNNLSSAREPLPQIENDLQELLHERQKIEEKLMIAKAHVADVEAQTQRLETQRNQNEADVRHAQSTLDKAKLDAESWRVRQVTIEEQLAELNQTVNAVRENMSDEAALEPWEDELGKIQQRIQRLGAINLAAIEEYQTQSERKTYLDKQCSDLQEALDVLQKAIQKIDRESRARFQETFDAVNQGFQHLFPKLFGGGSAKLELIGDDLLTTGIAMTAHPPGKRNATVHLLSGGEKALTAISLVFAIFQLNPAPFCMLDEVDAPLDDANVVRFGELVKEMSKTVQFVFITHNKVTMEMADQLLGVTMGEPGVSHLVAVDIEDAVQLAETEVA